MTDKKGQNWIDHYGFILVAFAHMTDWRLADSEIHVIDEKMELRRGFSISKGERIVIVEDIITTGGSVFELINLADELSAEIVHVLNLVDRSQVGIDFGYPSTALLNLPSESYNPNNCPLCEQGLPLIERGRTGKKMETI